MSRFLLYLLQASLLLLGTLVVLMAAARFLLPSGSARRWDGALGALPAGFHRVVISTA